MNAKTPPKTELALFIVLLFGRLKTDAKVSDNSMLQH